MVSGVPLGAFQEGDRLIVDGDAGVVLINPEPEVEGAYREAQQGPGEAWSPPCPADALPIPLRANVSVGRDLETARAHGAAGVGLYRSEYFFLRGIDGMGTEEEQYRLYSEPFRYFPSQPVTLRTLDLGGDKPFLPLSPVREANPLLGLRAVRLALQRPGVLRTQLRAMLRAAVHGHLRILFPMVTVAEELDQLRAELVACRKKLRTEGLACANEVSVGVMVEVPAVARAGDALFAKVDFISIGSNDLVQYALAVDRQSTTVAHLYQPLHPAVLRLIDDTVQAAHRLGRPVALCGELGTLPVALPALLALGVDELSVAPTAIPAVWDGLSRLRREACAPLRGPLLGAPSQAAVLALLEARFPELVDRRRLGGG
jgi:phosphotransferase system enzyme I (PtsI)